MYSRTRQAFENANAVTITRQFLPFEGSSLAAPMVRVGKTGNKTGDSLSLYSLFFALHPATLCNRSPNHSFFFFKDPRIFPVCGGAP